MSGSAKFWNSLSVFLLIILIRLGFIIHYEGMEEDVITGWTELAIFYCVVWVVLQGFLFVGDTGNTIIDWINEHFDKEWGSD
jgi:hypothetical protein